MVGAAGIRIVSRADAAGQTATPALPTMRLRQCDRKATSMAEASTMRWILLDTPRLEAGGSAAPASLPETAPAYLGLFLAAQDGYVARETVAAYLWPELATERAQHNLRVALNRLGTLLERFGIGASLLAERRRLRLQADSDLADFRAAIAAGHWARAAALPAGPLLNGVQFAPYPALAEWLQVEREALRRAWRQALVEGAATGAAIEESAARYLRTNAADAEITALLATRLAAAGQRQAALDLIAACRHAAGDELGADELNAALGPIAQAVAAVSSGVRPPDAPLGRDADLVRLDEAMRGGRWVSVVGLPGAGKSTLVAAWLEQRRAMLAEAPFVPFVRVAIGPRASAAALAETLLDKLAPRAGAAPQRLAALRGLAVLDGLDPAVLDDAWLPLLRSLAEQAQGLRVLVTSRQVLALPGETVLRLGGLPLEAGAGEPSAAARLFLREAERMRAGQRWTGFDADAERIARLTGGLPLALKLAATWSRWLEPRAVATEIERGVRRPDGAFDETLHAWIATPHARLPAPQQHALATLGLFAGPFDMAAAAAVADVVPETIEALVAQGLVDVEPGATPLLRLHALVRAFALARLAEAPARRRAAIARFLDQVQQRLGMQRSEHGQPVITHAQVAPCLDDVNEAWPLALETGALAMLPLLVQALHSWHEGAGDAVAGERKLAQAEAALDEAVPAEAALLARVHVARGTLLYRAGDHDAALARARGALRLAEATGQRRFQRMALNVIGLASWMTMRLDEARAAFQHGLASALEDGETRGQSIFGSNLGLVEKSRGDYAAAEAAWRRKIEIDRTTGEWWGATTGLNNLGNLLRHQRRFDECEAVAQEGLRLTHEHGLVTARPFALIGLALLRQAQGRSDEAGQYLDLLDACDPATLDEPVRAGAAQLRAQVALARGDAAIALQHIAGALRIAIDSDDPMNRAEALAIYGDWLAQYGNGSAAGSEAAERLWATLLRAPTTHATLRDELHARFAALGRAAPAAPSPAVDLTLAAEQALAAAAAAGLDFCRADS
jgi:DNA-binding SARP family transcriptional activator